ncbi:MAG: hypothetical protein R3F20_04090 [Planctomycetota bacterium]
MRSLSFLIAAAVAVVLATPLHADEITLKSGEKILDCKVIKKTDDKWRVELVDGKKIWIEVGDIVTHIEKETVGDEFDKRAKELDKKDVAGMIALGRWGLEKGVNVEAKKLLAKVVKLDSENAEARELLGHKKCDDGKWRYGSALETYERKKMEGEYKARGWVKLDDEWVPPSVAARRKAGLVEHEGRWVTKEDQGRLAKGDTWLGNDWYSKEELARIEAGEIREGGSWKSIEELDKLHRDPTNPWVLQSEHFVVLGPIGFKSNILVLEQAEKIWKHAAELFGDEPVCFDRATRIPIFITRDQASYAKTCNSVQPKPGPRQDAYCSCRGAICASRQGVIAYWYNADFTSQWIRHAASQAIMDRLWGYDRLGSNGFEALGAYFEACAKDGRFGPTAATHQYLTGWNLEDASPFAALTEVKVSLGQHNGTEIDRMWARAGYAMHWIIENYRPAFDAWMLEFQTGKATHKELIEGVKAASGMTDDQILEDFRRRLKTFQREYRTPPGL